MRIFELSYQGRVGWNGAEHGWLWADAASARKSRRNYIVNASIDQAAIGLGMATLMGACIGFERQSRQRMAGLRTNTLVAIGAAKARRLVRMTKLTHTGYLMGRQRFRSQWNVCIARKRKLKGGATPLVRARPKAPAMRFDDRTAD